LGIPFINLGNSRNAGARADALHEHVQLAVGLLEDFSIVIFLP
jgi:hypothetical protein